MRQYLLRCTGCGATFSDDGIQLDCPNGHVPALLRTEYSERSFTFTNEPSLRRYSAWLPQGREMVTAARSGIFRSAALAKRLDLEELWVSFNGWWPERGATLRTGTFKDLQAFTVLARLATGESRTLVLASAGNTAAAFADVCTENELPVVIIVPAEAFERVAKMGRIGPTVKVVAIEGAEYEDAIVFSRRLAATGGFILEGGVRNVGHRDGLGIVMLAAVERIGVLPDYYFQAVGSAAGALGAHEAARRLRDDGRFGSDLPHLMLAQNVPFTPLWDAWSVNAPVLIERSEDDAREQIAEIRATMLSNQTPPYAIHGGIREALSDTGGSVFAIGNREMLAAMELFAELEGIDIEPEAGIATAALIRAATQGLLERGRRVLLNVTGGGRKRLTRDSKDARPAIVLKREDVATSGVDMVRALYSSHR